MAASLAQARRKLPLLVVVPLIAAFAGCGGGSGGASADFTAKANAVCKQTLQQFERVQTIPPKTASEAGKQASALVSVSEQALNDLHGLTPPSSAKDAYDRYLSSREQALQYLKAGQKAASHNDASAYARAKRQAANQQATRLKLAREAGLKGCSVPALTLGTGK